MKATWTGEGWQQEGVKVWLEDAGEVQPGGGTSSRSGSSQNRSLSPATIHDRLQTQTSSTWTLAANGLLINSVEKAEEFVAKLYESTNQATNSITCRSIKVQFFKPA